MKAPLLVLLAVGSARAQTPTGIIAGVVTDTAGAPIAAARVRLTNLDSMLIRSLTTSAEGDYSAAVLPPGAYQVTAEANGFSLLQRTATVETGTTTTVNLTLQVGEVRDRAKTIWRGWSNVIIRTLLANGCPMASPRRL